MHSGDVGSGEGKEDDGGEEGKEPWVLVNSTPATCAQIGISHFFEGRGKVDLVVSGPNYGRYVSGFDVVVL